MCVLVGSVAAAAAGTVAVGWFTWRIETLESGIGARIDAVTRVNDNVAAGTVAVQDPGAAVVELATVTELGNPVHATGTVIAIDGTSAYVATTLESVRRATWDAELTVDATDASGSRTAQIWAWDERAGLALVVIDFADAGRLAVSDTAVGPGARLAVSGAATPATVESVDRAGTIRFVAPTDLAAGSPVVDETGRLAAFVPAKTTAGSVVEAISARRLCDRLISCSS